MLSQIERASKNAPIQGLASEITKTAMIEFRRYLIKNNLRDKAHLYMQIHDELIVNHEDDITDEISKALQEIMEKAAEVCLGNTLLKVDINTSKKW